MNRQQALTKAGNDANDFTTGSIPKKMLRFMLPIFGSLVLQAMYGAVDLLVVGRFGTTAGLSGVSTGSNVLNVVTFTVTGFAMAVTILIGRYLGEKRNEKIGPLLGATICLFLILSLFLCAVMVGFARPIAVIMQSPAGALVLQAMYGAVDLLVVGRFGSRAGLSGVSTGSNVLNLITFVITALAMGVTVVIGHDLGERKPEKISPLIGGAVLVFAGIAVVLCLIMTIWAKGIASLMMAPPEALDLTAQYIRICGAGIFFIVAYNVIAAIFRGLGDSKTPLLFVAIACIINVFGDLLLVAGFHMNVAGAAIATVAAQAVSVILSLVIMAKKALPFTMKKSDIRLGTEAGHILQVGAPLALQEFLTQISFVCLCAFINRLGLTASSGYGVASKLISFIMLVPSSLMQSMSSFISQNVGAGKERRARQAMGFGMAFAFCVGVVIFALIQTKGYLAAGLFSTDADVIADAWDYLRGFGGETLVTPFLFSFMGYFNGHERSLFVMLQSMAQTLLVRLPFAWFMSIQQNASLLWIGLAAPLATSFGILLNLCYFLHYNRKVILPRQKQQQAEADTPAPTEAR